MESRWHMRQKSVRHGPFSVADVWQWVDTGVLPRAMPVSGAGRPTACRACLTLSSGPGESSGLSSVATDSAKVNRFLM